MKLTLTDLIKSKSWFVIRTEVIEVIRLKIDEDAFV